jgi:hypothetical protein
VGPCSIMPLFDTCLPQNPKADIFACVEKMYYSCQKDNFCELIKINCGTDKFESVFMVEHI